MILNISEAANLGIHALSYLANYSVDKTPISTVQVARAFKVSENHLSKVFQRLTKMGLVKSIRGPRGGFLLAKDPGEITLLQIYEAIDGPLTTGEHCMLGTPTCGYEHCIFGNLAKNVENDVYQRFSTKTLQDLIEDK